MAIIKAPKMPKINPAAFKTKAKMYIRQHGPSIAIASGVSGLIFAGVHAVKETPKYLQLKKEKEDQEKRDLTFKENAKIICHVYWLDFVIASLSSFTVFTATNTILEGASAWALYARRLEDHESDIREAMREEIGKTKSERILTKADEKEIERDYDQYGKTIPVFNVGANGQFVYKEPWSGRYFRADRSYVLEKWNMFVQEVNALKADPFYCGGKRTTNTPSLPLNRFYELLGLEETDLGSEMLFYPDDPCDGDYSPLSSSLYFTTDEPKCIGESVTVIHCENKVYKYLR